jgi:hypothetical protein
MEMSENQNTAPIQEIPEGTAKITINLENVDENNIEEVRNNILSCIGFLDECKVRNKDKTIRIQRKRNNETAAFGLAFDTSIVQDLTKQGVIFIIPEEN